MSEDNKNKDEQSFSGDEKNEGFLGTPENYFDSFSSRLFSKIKANDELKEYPLLSAIEKNNPFFVPAGYFEAKEELLEFPVLRDLKQKSFVVPADYFEHVAATVSNKIAVEEEVKIYASLSAIGKEKVFALPENYFEEFSGHLRELIAPVKVVPLYGRVLRSYQFAVAAAVLLVVALTVILMNQKTEVAPDQECTTLACISKKEIINSHYIQNLSEESIIDMIDEKTLNADSILVKKNGKEVKLGADEVSDEIDVNTLTEEL